MVWCTKITSLVQRMYDWLGISFWFVLITKGDSRSGKSSARRLLSWNKPPSFLIAKGFWFGWGHVVGIIAMTVMLDLPLELSVALKVLMVDNLLEIAIRCWDDRVRLLG